LAFIFWFLLISDEISSELKEVKDEKLKLQKDLESLRQAKDSLLAKYTELKKKFDSMGSEVINLQGNKVFLTIKCILNYSSN